MKNKILLISLMTALITIFSSKAAFARCVSQYGGGETCYEGELRLDKVVKNPSSGTYTAGPTANRIGVYMYGGGGGGVTNNCMCGSQRPGGNGGAGFYNKPIAQPFSQGF